MNHDRHPFEIGGDMFPVTPQGEYTFAKRHYPEYVFEDATVIFTPAGQKIYNASNKASNNLKDALLLGINVAAGFTDQELTSQLNLHDITTAHHGTEQMGYDRYQSIGYVKDDNRLTMFTELFQSPNSPRKLACIMAQSAVLLCAVPRTGLEQFHQQLVDAPALPIEEQDKIREEVYNSAK